MSQILRQLLATSKKLAQHRTKTELHLNPAITKFFNPAPFGVTWKQAFCPLHLLSLMALEIQNATPEDAAELTQVFYAAFGGEFNRTMFPQEPDVTAWWEHSFNKLALRTQANEGNAVLLKITDEKGAIAAFAKWKRPVTADRDQEHEEPVDWAPSSDKDLCERFFSSMDGQHQKWMEDRPHYCELTPTTPLPGHLALAVRLLVIVQITDLTQIWICLVFIPLNKVEGWHQNFSNGVSVALMQRVWRPTCPHHQRENPCMKSTDSAQSSHSRHSLAMYKKR